MKGYLFEDDNACFVKETNDSPLSQPFKYLTRSNRFTVLHMENFQARKYQKILNKCLLNVVSQVIERN